MNAITDRTEIARIIRDRPEQLRGFTVTTIDGEAGHVASSHQEEVDDLHLVIHLGNRFLGKDVVIEADAIDAVDPEQQTIHVDRIRDWVKSSPKVSAVT